MQMKRGKWTGDGAIKNVSLGFIPDFVIVANVTDNTNLYIFINDVVAPTGSIDIDAAAGPLADAGGITAYAGDLSNAMGFTVDAGNNVNAKVFRYVAFGGHSE